MHDDNEFFSATDLFETTLTQGQMNGLVGGDIVQSGDLWINTSTGVYYSSNPNPPLPSLSENLPSSITLIMQGD